MFLTQLYSIGNGATKGHNMIGLGQANQTEQQQSREHPGVFMGSTNKIEVTPMIQRFEIKDQAEDWTGKTNTALRRKLQNRLNQRAFRKCQLFNVCGLVMLTEYQARRESKA